MKSVYDLKGYSLSTVEMLEVSFPQEEGSLFQNEEEEIIKQTSFLLKILNKVKPHTILEVGTHKANFCYFAKLALPGVAVDTFGNNPESADCVSILNGMFGDYIKFYLGNSRLSLSQYKPPHKIDFAWVDGGHDYQTCLSDLKNCERLGIKHICVDDYKPSLPWSVYEPTMTFVEQSKYSVKEISQDARQICYISYK